MPYRSMFSVTFWLCCLVPAVPTMVSVNGPVGPVFCDVTVSTDVPVPPAVRSTTGGLNEPVVLEGKPLTLRLTPPANPLSEVTVTV